MKKTIKIIALILIFTTIFMQSVFADETMKFSDLDERYWAYESIEKLVNAGIIVGYPDGTFEPEGDITRAELVKIVNLVFSFDIKQETTNLTDIGEEEWFYDYVLAAQNAGYIDGYEDETFRPNNNVTRQELCKILDAINGFIELPFDKEIADNIDLWAEAYVRRVVTNRIMSLDENNNFRATEKATRAEACDALAKFLLEEALEEPEAPPTSGSGSVGDDTPSKQELNETMSKVVRRLKNGVIPELSNSLQKEIVDDIISSMEKYQSNDNHDYEAAADKAYEKYKKLTADEQKELKQLIQRKNTINDLYELKEFFFPDVEI